MFGRDVQAIISLAGIWVGGGGGGGGIARTSRGGEGVESYLYYRMKACRTQLSEGIFKGSV